MRTAMDLSLSLYPVKRPSNTKHVRPPLKTRPPTVYIEPYAPDRTDLRLFLVPVAIPTKEESVAKPQPDILCISSDSDIEMLDPPPKETNLTGFKRKFAPPKQPKKKRQTLAASTKVKKTAKKRATITAPIYQPASEFNKLMKFFQTIIQSHSFPPQRIIEEFYHYAYIRNDPTKKWKSYEFLHAFLYLRSLYSPDIAIKIGAHILGRSESEIETKMGVLRPKREPKESFLSQNILKQEQIRFGEENYQGKISRDTTGKKSISIIPTDEKILTAVNHVPSKSDLQLRWPNAWLALLETLNLSKSYLTKLHEVFYSHQWIRERYLTEQKSKNGFDDNRLVEKLSMILPAAKQYILPLLVASISGKCLESVREFFFNQRNNENMEEALASPNLANYTTHKIAELREQARALITSLGYSEPTDLSQIQSLIKNLEAKQKLSDPSLLLKLCERSRVLLSREVKHSGGFFVVNTLDDGNIPNFVWIQENILGRGLNGQFSDLSFLTGCSCLSDCGNSVNDCQCMHEMQHANDNLKHLPPYTKDGKLNPRFKQGFPIYECNSACKCGPACTNRVVQKNPNSNFIIFKDRRKGWGVRTLDLIPQGTYVCEYMGEVITSEEAEIRGRQYDKRGLSFLLDLDLCGRDCQYTIDATNYGNVSRFFNHSCEPNTQIFYVFVDCLDWARPKICFFATKDIQPGEEITFDYKYDVTNKPRLKCFCGMPSCRGWLV